MAFISQNEALLRAARFAAEWKDATKEKQDTHSFLNDFFGVFGIDRKKVAVFEHFIEKLGTSKKRGAAFVDLLWPKKILIEQKSLGKNLDDAFVQAMNYRKALNDEDKPEWVMVCDFQNFLVRRIAKVDIEVKDIFEHREWTEEYRFTLQDYEKWCLFFAPEFWKEDLEFFAPEDLDYHVAEKLAELRDKLHELEYPEDFTIKFLIRIVFCLFAADSGIIEYRNIFYSYLRTKTREDGHDFGIQLGQIYRALNQKDRKQIFITGVKDFPYINGGIFDGNLPDAPFDLGMRKIILDLGKKNWRQISPIIFGTLFESVMEPKERRELGVHYTSEENILRVLGPLFLTELQEELEQIKNLTHQSEKLHAYEQKLRGLKFFDPACGCGSFLLCAYEQIRKLELESILVRRESAIAQNIAVNGNPDYEPRVNVDQFYGIELNPTAQAITEAALWMIDQLQNIEFSKSASIQNRKNGDKTEVRYSRIPITSSPNIIQDDALELDWESVLPAAECSYIIGNPPFVGAKMQSPKQRQQLRRIADLGGNGGTLDFVCAWFIRATDYNQNGRARIGFVASNSICQGEQVEQLWPIILDKYKHQILFAHQTFAWQSPLKKAAAVHCVIIGLNREDDKPAKRILFHYDSENRSKAKGKNSRGKRQDGIYGKPRIEIVDFISPSLLNVSSYEFSNLIVASSKIPMNGFPRMIFGSQPIDGGHFHFDESQKNKLLLLEPRVEKFLFPLIGAKNMLSGKPRWILSLKGITSDELKAIPVLSNIVESVREFRLKSLRKTTLEFAKFPDEFAETVIPKSTFLCVPRVSTERLKYIPVAFFEPPVIPNGAVEIVIDPPLWLFGILSSALHMLWFRNVGGKLKSDPRYSITIVYNTFPVPDGFHSKAIKLEPLAQEILDIRAETPDSSLATLYDPKFMTSKLTKAHQSLDRAVDRLYDPKGFETDQQRLAHLFALYEKQIAERE
ncbi:MAG: N-6 DNA methylase [Candidatus Pacebacteria bacterium]|nr:N-6 DNA methylase [Candidatus Paceibacterota bacterium]